MPRPYVCPAPLPSSPPAPLPVSPNVWANLGYPYSEPAIPVVPAGAGAGGPPPLDPRRRFNWPPNYGRPSDSPEGYQARDWDIDLPSNSWAASATSDWWYPAPLRNGAAMPRPAELSGPSPPPPPPPPSPPPPPPPSVPALSQDWARGDVSVPLLPGTVYRTSPPRGPGVQPHHHFGGSSLAGRQALAGGARGAHGGSGGDTGNQGWLDWVGSYVNTAQSRVLEHFDAPGTVGGSAPTLTWTPPQMQPLADDPDVRRQTQMRSVPGDAPARIRAAMAEARTRSISRRDFDPNPQIGRRAPVYPTASVQRQSMFGVGGTPTPLVVTSVPL